MVDDPDPDNCSSAEAAMELESSTGRRFDVVAGQEDWISISGPLSLLPLHQERGQKPGQPGKAWPGRAFRVFGQAYRENAAW